ncbi:hypothetical protein [Paracidovorax valerianellae]|nr:hypothetical protein [Paracidovorax valerianellae]
MAARFGYAEIYGVMLAATLASTVGVMLLWMPQRAPRPSLPQ